MERNFPWAQQSDACLQRASLCLPRVTGSLWVSFCTQGTLGSQTNPPGRILYKDSLPGVEENEDFGTAGPGQGLPTHPPWHAGLGLVPPIPSLKLSPQRCQDSAHVTRDPLPALQVFTQSVVHGRRAPDSPMNLQGCRFLAPLTDRLLRVCISICEVHLAFRSGCLSGGLRWSWNVEGLGYCS